MISSAVLFILCTLLSMLAHRPSSQKQADAESYLSKLQEVEVQQIQELIEASEMRIALSKAKTDAERNRIKFTNTIILGDSIVEGLSDYHLLKPTQAISTKGRRIDNCAKDIKKAAPLSPKRVILHYGMNDLEYCRGNEKQFIKYYQGAVALVRKLMPKAEIYVHAILPIDSSAIAKTPVYAKWKSFNQALKKLCQTEKIKFIDGGFLLKKRSDYESDGIHPKYSFYEKWLPYLLEVLK